METLTDRQEEMLRAFGTGLPFRRIAEDLKMNERTVKAHADTLRRKFRVGTARELVSVSQRYFDGES